MRASVFSRYTADEYDLIEELAAQHLTDAEIGAQLDPPVSGSALGQARRRAGIPGRRRGRIAKAENRS